jgi:hypothetical protein
LDDDDDLSPPVVLVCRSAARFAPSNDSPRIHLTGPLNGID